MPETDGVVERRLLVVSMAATGTVGVVGVVWGILASSQMILLDGVYALVGIALSALLLWASAAAEREPTRQFQFGMEAATPLAIAIQSFVLLATLLYAAVEALSTIRAGGSEVTAGWGIAYGVVVAIASAVVAVGLKRRAGHSDLLNSEALAWRVAAVRGVGMIIGFGVLALLDRSRWSDWGPYIDPVMVLVTCVALVPTPVRLLRQTIGELLEGAPPASISTQVHDAIRAVKAEFDLEEPTVHLAKVGPKLYVEVISTARPDVTIGEEHQVRESLRRRLADLPHDTWLSVELLPRDSA